MDYDKEILVLKQIESGYSVKDKSVGGIARFEKENGICTLFLSTVNISVRNGGEYYLILFNGIKITAQSLGVKPSTEKLVLDSFIPHSFAVGIAFVSNGIPTLIAFSKCDGCNLTLTDFKKESAGYFLKQKNLSAYNDEAVATENYYEKEELNLSNDIEKKESVFLNDKPENNFDSPPYYQKVKDELEKIFSNFPEEQTLKKAYSFGKWAKITYYQDKYYVVGIIYEGEREKYICYGVPSKSHGEEPPELKGYCTYLPLSVFDYEGEGFWMMFQDAVTGKCVKKIQNPAI